MLLEEVDGLVKSLRRTPLFPEGADGHDVALGRDAIQRLIPHREPFLLIDALDAVDRAGRRIRGRRHVRPDDPVFVGHFPGRPVYPGVLQVEAMGQLALCLAGLLADEGDSEAGPVDIRATRIHHALFLEPVVPGDRLTLAAGIVDDTGVTAVCVGQVWREATLCSCSVLEVCFVD